jgi:predicted transglutaminase-like cysteine proteinase
MRRHLALKPGLWLCVLVSSVFGYLLVDWRADNFSADQKVGLALPSPSTYQTVGLGLPNSSASQSAELRLPELSASQIVGFRSPELSGFTNVAVVPEASAVGSRVVADPARTAALEAPAPLFQLIDFHATAALPPIGHSRFCVRYPNDCKVQGIDFRRRNITLTPERWNELKIINRRVNSNILATVTAGNGATEQWRISPPAGDCKDYAITKRHELLARGWPSRSLLLSEVVVSSGEHHLLLIVRVKDADLVLDNLSDEIQLVSMTHDQYHWVRIQSPQNPKFWTRLKTPNATHTAMLSN